MRSGFGLDANLSKGAAVLLFWRVYGAEPARLSPPGLSLCVEHACVAASDETPQRPHGPGFP